jgi:hypothetical protein
MMDMLNKQRGSTLLVSLVMLLLLTLMAISATNSTTSSIQIVGNAQFHEEAMAATQVGIETTLSRNFTMLPVSAAIPVNFAGATYSAQIDVPTCTSSIKVTNSELSLSNPDDMNCLSSGGLNNTGTVNASGVVDATAQSWCYKQNWDLRATVSDDNSGANVVVHQGVYLRVEAGTLCPS